jgi:hypothetical protein
MTVGAGLRKLKKTFIADAITHRTRPITHIRNVTWQRINQSRKGGQGGLLTCGHLWIIDVANTGADLWVRGVLFIDGIKIVFHSEDEMSHR